MKQVTIIYKGRFYNMYVYIEEVMQLFLFYYLFCLPQRNVSCFFLLLNIDNTC